MQVFVYAAFQRFSRGYMQLSAKKRGICGLVFGLFTENMDLNHAGKCQKRKEITFSDKK